MATAEELLATVGNEENYIVIDSDLRTMTFPASVKNIGVENDKDVNKLNFMMPRYFSEYDLSTFNIRINYLNAQGDGDMYVVTEPTVEDDAIYFTWLVGRHAYLYKGAVTFIVCLKLADGEGDVAQEFNTTLASLQVLPGLETEPTILETDYDIIEQLLLTVQDTNDKIKAVLDSGMTAEELGNIAKEQKTLKARMDEFASLPDGSTAGDAELTDIRVGANGTVYKNAGSAVRDQVSDLKTDLGKKVTIDEYKQVDELNTTFFTIGDNRYNVNDVTDGVQLNQTTDGTHEQSGFSTSNKYIYVGDLTTIKFMRLNAAGTAYITDSAFYQLYDVNKNRIGNRSSGSSVDVSNATWMLVSNSTQYKTSFMIVDNNLDVVSFIPYSFTFNYLEPEIKEKVDKHGTAQVNEKNTTFFSIGDNKFDSANVTDGVQLNQATDGTHEQSEFCTTDYIDISNLSDIKFLRLNAAGTEVVPESFYYILYDANKLMIAPRALASTVNVSSATYIRASLSTANKSTAMICDSDLTVTEYIPFGYVFDYLETAKTVTIYPSDHVLSKLIANKGKDIHFADGNYDIIAIYEDYYGSDFFTNYSGYSSDALCRGIPVYQGTKMEFSPNARFTCNYSGGNTYVRMHFSAFAFEGGVTFDGLNIVASGIRNIIHDDFDNNYVGNTVIKNCHFTHDHIIIAGGLAVHEVVEIYNNYFERTDDTTHVFDFSYHQNSASEAQSEIIIKDNYCSKGISIRYYGSSTLLTDCLISNNSVANDIELRGETETSTVVNMRVLKWNNEIRNS